MKVGDVIRLNGIPVTIENIAGDDVCLVWFESTRLYRAKISKDMADASPKRRIDGRWTGRIRRRFWVWTQQERERPAFIGAKWQNPWNMNRWPRHNVWVTVAGPFID